MELARGLELWSYLTPEEVAEQLRVTRATVYAWLKMGKLPGVRAGKGWRIRPEDVQVFVEQSTRQVSEAAEKSSRLYSREEILDFLAEDDLDPELLRKVRERLQAA
jgi:putative molybdopterin biosynthesis protein